MKKISNLLKTNRIIYYIYNFLFSFLLRVIGLFIKIDDKLVLFNSFGGKKFDDSPKAIYEYMKSNKKYSDYKLIWALNDPHVVDGLDVMVVKNNSFKFFLTALKAGYWITNSSMERGLKFKKKKTFYINTWHGSVIKKIDVKKERLSFRVSESDCLYAQSHIDVDYFSEKWSYPKEKIALCGYPRNDELCHFDKKEEVALKKKLGIPLDKKVIIYAPTFRDNDYDSNGCYIAPPIDLKKWKTQLESEYVLLFRAHYEINKVLNIIDDDFIYNVTDYPCLNDLLKISDIMISDYSSIMIDYSILERPIFCFAYDYEKYLEERGFAYDIKKELPNGIVKTEDELLKQIANIDLGDQRNKTIRFRSKHLEVFGNASKYVDTIIGLREDLNEKK